MAHRKRLPHTAVAFQRFACRAIGVRHWAIAVVAFLLVALAALLAIHFGINREATVLGGLLIGAGGGCAVGAVARLITSLRGEPGTIELRRRTVRFTWGSRSWTVPYESITDGYRRDANDLTFSTRNGNVIRATLEDEKDRDVLLDAIARGADDRAFAVPTFGNHTPPAVAALPVLLAVFVAVAFVPVQPMTDILIGGGALTTVLLFVLDRIVRGSIAVGRDGIALAGLVRDEPFIPYGELKTAHADAGTIVLKTTKGRETRVPIASNAPSFDPLGLAAKRTVTVLERIRREQKAWARRGEPAARMDVFARNGRTRRAWRDEVRKLLASATYRGASIDRDEVLRIVEDPGLDPDVRAGAVMALGDDREARRRVRIAVATSANPRVRVALERAARDAEADAEAIDESACPPAKKRA